MHMYGGADSEKPGEHVYSTCLAPVAVMAREMEGSEKLADSTVPSPASESAMPPPQASPAEGSTARVWSVDIGEEAEECEIVEKSLRATRPETSQSKPLNYWEKRAGTHDQPTTWADAMRRREMRYSYHCSATVCP